MYTFLSIENATELSIVVNSILSKIKDLKIQKVFSSSVAYLSFEQNRYCGAIDDKLYIMFENQLCLIIDFRQISMIDIEPRKLTKKEMKNFEQLSNDINDMKDIFNTSIMIVDNVDKVTESVSKMNVKLIYDSITEIKIRKNKQSYDKWIQTCQGPTIATIPAGGDYFDQIALVLKNGAKIHLSPQDAINDGYCDVWVVDDGNNYKLTV